MKTFKTNGIQIKTTVSQKLTLVRTATVNRIKKKREIVTLGFFAPPPPSSGRVSVYSVSKMAEWVNVFFTKADDVGSVPRTHVREERTDPTELTQVSTHTQAREPACPDTHITHGRRELTPQS